MELRLHNKKVFIVHDPKFARHDCEINLTAHVHLAWKVKRLNPKSIMVNIGVDAWAYYPVTFDEIMKRVNEFTRSGQ